MSKPASLTKILRVVRQSNLIAAPALDALLAGGDIPSDPSDAIQYLVQAGLLTRFHAHHLLQGHYKRFTLGQYTILSPLGQGGVGLVYLAEHAELKRRVAIKVLRGDRQSDVVLERFFRESRAAAALDHPNLIRVNDFCLENDVYFLVMEYVKGQTFDEVLKLRGRLPPREAAGLVVQAARGLAHAHARGVIHRDVKPSNLLVDTEGVVKILDLGLARFLDHRADRLTEQLGGGVALGSPDYIAPEQALNQATELSDVYSLGATFYALLVGEPPFKEARTISRKLAAHQSQPVVPPHHREPSIPEELSLAVVRMLAKDPADRFQTVEEVIAALSPWAAPNQAAPAPLSDGPMQTVERPWWRGRAATLAAMALATLAVATLGGWAALAAVAGR